jgi:hypothetical protein
MPADIYAQMLDEFGDTFARTSKDSDEKAQPKGRGVYMTSSQAKVVNFDKFKESITRKYALENSPNSCDALYMHSENEWFLIEFKNGKIDKEKVFQIRGKIFQSLLLLTEKLDKTIGFTREKLTFILVYNEEYNPRTEIVNFMDKLANDSQFLPFRLKNLQKIYLKKSVFGIKKNSIQTLWKNTLLPGAREALIFSIENSPTILAQSVLP